MALARRVFKPARDFDGLDKTVHFTAVDILNRGGRRVGSAVIDIIGVVVRFDALSGRRVVDTNSRRAILHRDAVRAGISAKIVIKRAVFLHDDDDMFDPGSGNR